ncbi:unnamed protein product [Vitrella brassicaformis CCMP3155]|uniref:Glycosyltransferase 2-like domain-containing protein n=2 Tax=Vitrella brassicaformis TaxID=1169539 RepID=A0A0G4EQD8_VITBC|nr:unnamed protein product [Vitrella brassicaformis CCMP3155]|eukprot:CEL99845.1 unnamed protein product [Vitrella brassicaformis CCMP3155]
MSFQFGPLNYLVGVVGLALSCTWCFAMLGGFTCLQLPYGCPTVIFMGTSDVYVAAGYAAFVVFGLPWMIQIGIGFLWPMGVLWPSKITREQDGELRKITICFRVVTRGDSRELVRQICQTNKRLLMSLSQEDKLRTRWRIEVVTDKPIGIREVLQDYTNIREIVVPTEFKSAHNTKYKARALHYANEASDLGPNDWIVHLDEETLLAESSVIGIIRHVNEHTFLDAHKKRIGQGVIVYGHDDIINLPVTMADSIRVSDDYCRFRMFFTLGYPLQGMKGSFVVVPVDVEKDVSFDLGPEGSITEDAVFALKAMQKGYKFAFISGVMREKSPFTFLDFLKQRRRWIQGLWLTVLRKDLSARNRILLFIMMVNWSLMPIIQLGGYLLVLFTRQHTMIYITIRTITLGIALWVYAFGAIHNFDPKRHGWIFYIGAVLATSFFAWYFAFLECLASVWATPSFLWERTFGFHVVKKEYKGMGASHVSGTFGTPASTRTDDQVPVPLEVLTESSARDNNYNNHNEPTIHTANKPLNGGSGPIHHKRTTSTADLPSGGLSMGRGNNGTELSGFRPKIASYIQLNQNEHEVPEQIDIEMGRVPKQQKMPTGANNIDSNNNYHCSVNDVEMGLLAEDNTMTTQVMTRKKGRRWLRLPWGNKR